MDRIDPPLAIVASEYCCGWEVAVGVSETVESQVNSLMVGPWTVTAGRKIPATEDLALMAAAGVELEATYLYSDLANSSLLGQKLNRTDAAKVIKSFLYSASTLIKYHGGEIKGFDGDRVLGVFHGHQKEMRAVRAAFNIHWVVDEVISDKASRWVAWPDGTQPIRHATGIATGAALLVRGGVRNDNDLVSIGSPPNLAAKLSELRERPERTFVDWPTWLRAFGDTDKDAAGNSLWGGPEIIIVGDSAHMFRGSSTRRKP